MYVVPGLRRSTRRFANALGKSVPILNGLPELIPQTTQRDDIEELRQALMRLPKRVVVLLDELDRMENKEIRTLLKVVRGVSSLPNLSFVCAAERHNVVVAMRGGSEDERNRYFEKFFPVVIPVPTLDSADLRHAGIERLVTSMQQRRWFISGHEEEAFRGQLVKLWDSRIAPWCGTLRAIGLLANDVGGAAAPLRREVDPVDLVLIELLRRFEPAIYDLVSRNGLALTGGEGMFRGKAYHSDQEKKRLLDQFRKDIIREDETRLNHIKSVLGELFPDFARTENLTWVERPKRKGEESPGKRIADPSIFPAYFRYELPKAMFSAVDLEQFTGESRNASGEEARRGLFREKLRSMEEGSLRRDDFLLKLADSVRTVDQSVARSWVFAALTLADDLTYDLFSGFGEAGHLIRMITRLGERMPQSERAPFLLECIRESTDDTMPVRILTVLTNPESDGYLGVPFADLYPSFVGRMRSRYGVDVDAAAVDLRTSDPNAFAIWGAEDLSKYGLEYDPQDRLIQNSFWKRYIGSSRSKLIRVFNESLMPRMGYQGDPEETVKRKMDVGTLRKLFVGLPDDAGMQDIPPGYVIWMRRFLNGDFKGGVGPNQFNEAGDMETV
jgi:hypothetical protein